MVHRPVRELSYGERARLMLALLVMQDVNCLLLDEPLNHLDITSRTEFEEALVAFGGTILMVAHDRYTVRRVATRAVRLEGGLLFDAADAISTEE